MDITRCWAGFRIVEGLKARKHQRTSMRYLIKECEVL